MRDCFFYWIATTPHEKDQARHEWEALHAEAQKIKEAYDEAVEREFWQRHAWEWYWREVGGFDRDVEKYVDMCETCRGRSYV